MYKKSIQIVRNRVIAIDPGYDRCGVAILEWGTGKNVLVYSSCITTDAKTSFTERLRDVGKKIKALIRKYKPSVCAIENLYFNTNQKTAMRVAEVRGMIMYIASDAEIPVHEYTPPQVKLAVTGWGKSDKKQMVRMIPMIVGIEKKIAFDDEYDAIALGITHLNSKRGQKIFQ